MGNLRGTAYQAHRACDTLDDIAKATDRAAAEHGDVTLYKAADRRKGP